MPSHSQLDVSSRTERDVGVVVAAGEIDLATVSGFRDAISDLVARGLVHLVLDLTAVTFIDSTGLGVMVGARKKVRQVGGSLRLVCTDHRVLRLLAVTGLTKAFPVHPTSDEAMTDRPGAVAVS